VLGAAVLAACGSQSTQSLSWQRARIQKIKHVIVIMQENRSFDSYFGTFPGADGIATKTGTAPVCLPDLRKRVCTRLSPDHADVNVGGPHSAASAFRDWNGGKMDGFVATAERARTGCDHLNDPACANNPVRGAPVDVLGYHTQGDIPNYWAYANQFVLQDHMFEPTTSWSLPSHLFAVSAWSANCTRHNVPASCSGSNMPVPTPPFDNASGAQTAERPIYAWTDLTYLLHKNHVSWGYYVATGNEPDCADDEALTCLPVRQSATTPGIWNPLPYFDTVANDRQRANIQAVSNFYNAAKKGTLPAVSWIVPSAANSEHPPATVSAGQSYVTSLVNAVMRSPEWSSSAIFISWDDWGGFYDHVAPPVVDSNGYGFRVPGLVVSPYAKRGYVDHQSLSFDAYLKFIEDDFLHGQRLDPKTDGRSDPRPRVREDATILGDLTADFDFAQQPRPPMILDVHPETTLTSRRSFAPRHVHANANGTGTLVSWQAPLSDGGVPIIGYQVTAYRRGIRDETRTFGSAATSERMSGLVGDTSYTFVVTAITARGLGVPSAPSQPFQTRRRLAPRSPSILCVDASIRQRKRHRCIG
jgi:phospholipase C